MESLDEIIEKSTEVREVKRAVSVKMVLSGMVPGQICECLKVSPQYVSKWKVAYEVEGPEALLLRYRGSESYLSVEQRGEIAEWIGGYETLRVEEVRDYVEEHYGVIYQSKQSYYELLEAGGMSYHRSEPDNPKHDPEQVVERRAEIKKNWRRTGRRLRGGT